MLHELIIGEILHPWIYKKKLQDCARSSKFLTFFLIQDTKKKAKKVCPVERTKRLKKRPLIEDHIENNLSFRPRSKSKKTRY